MQHVQASSSAGISSAAHYSYFTVQLAGCTDFAHTQNSPSDMQHHLAAHPVGIPQDTYVISET